jgi:DNA polymerase-3 subunit delta'
MGWAVQAVEDENLLAERKEQLDTLTQLLSANRVERFAAAQRLSEDTGKLRAILELWLLWWRDIVLAAYSSLDLVVNVDMRSTIAKQAAQVGPAEAERMARAILSTMEALEQNVNARVALEVLMLDMPMIR